jgi:FemAB-related protein (PEP-CTERM system-associated)
MIFTFSGGALNYIRFKPLMKNISLINDSQNRIWDEFILSSNIAGPYMLYAWGQAARKAYGHKAFNIMSFGPDGKADGALPLVFIKPPFLKGLLVSLPFCDYGGIISSNDETADGLAGFASELASSLGAELEIRSKSEIPALKEKYGMGVISHKVRMKLELPQSSHMLWEGFKSKLRSQIKKPRKEGLVFRLGGIELLDDFYDVFRINMHDLGSPVHSKKWISSVLELMGNKARTGIVYRDEEAIGGGIILACGDTITIPWASTLAEYNSLSPNMMLYWGFLEYASDNGFRFFDFGRSTPGEGTYKFKEQWGAKPEPLFWYGKGFKDETDGMAFSGHLRKKAEEAWSKLPQKLADFLGPVLRRYISL